LPWFLSFIFFFHCRPHPHRRDGHTHPHGITTYICDGEGKNIYKNIRQRERGWNKHKVFPPGTSERWAAGGGGGGCRAYRMSFDWGGTYGAVVVSNSISFSPQYFLSLSLSLRPFFSFYFIIFLSFLSDIDRRIVIYDYIYIENALKWERSECCSSAHHPCFLFDYLFKEK
jgi:hypothetical protein